MDRRAVAAMALVLSFSAAGNLHAMPLAGMFHHGAPGEAPSVKMISFTVRNDASTPLVIKAGDQQLTIEPGKSAKLKVPEGVAVVNVSGTGKQPAGTVLTTVMKQLEGNTLAVS